MKKFSDETFTHLVSLPDSEFEEGFQRALEREMPEIAEPLSEEELRDLRTMADIGQLQTNKLVLPGDDSIQEKSLRMLNLFVEQASTGKVSKPMLYWVMHSIQNYLEKKEPSLDAAFKLKVKGRPTTLTPNREQEIVEAYLDVVRASGQIDLTKETLQKAESAAFKALYGKTPEELRGSRSHHSKAIGIKANHNLHDFGSVDDGLTRIRRVLKKYNALLK